MSTWDLTDAFFVLIISMSVYAVVVGGRALLHFFNSPPPVPREVPAPKRTPSVRDRLAMAQRNAHARELHQADQEVHRG